MDSFELNKIAGAVFLCLLVVMGVKSVAEIVYAEEHQEELAYHVEGLEVAAEAAAAEPEEEGPSFAMLLADADPGKGERIFRRCVSCHTIEDGGDNKIGPNLFNIVGNHSAHKGDFAYSDAMANANLTWTYENLNEYITSPANFVPGNKMAFAGIRRDDQRADLIAYLAQNSPDAPPPPQPEAADAAEEGMASGAAEKAAPEGEAGSEAGEEAAE